MRVAALALIPNAISTRDAVPVLIPNAASVRAAAAVARVPGAAVAGLGSISARPPVALIRVLMITTVSRAALGCPTISRAHGTHSA